MNRFIKVLSFWVICGISITTLLACGKPDKDSATHLTKGDYSITGVVKEDNDSSAVADARVFTIPATHSVNTKSDGSFTISNIQSGDYVLAAEKIGYFKSSVSVSLNDKVTQKTIYLKKSSLPFHAGVTFNFWFQPNSASQIDFGMYSKQDFINAKKLGCDVIRLPINLNFMTNGAPNYTISTSFFNLLDQVVSWAEDLHIYLILDNHSYYADGLPPNIEPLLKKVWGQMAKHYKDRSQYILYEILNEPHGISNADWGRIQGDVIDVIRSHDTDHTIIVNPNGFSSYNNLSALPKYTDDNLVYDFHFYDPMVFTHQGASFINPPLTNLTGVPFPYDPSRMPSFPSDLSGTFFQQQFENYENVGTVAYLKGLMDIAIAFRNSTGAKIYCGEFGVLNKAPSNDRIFWYNTVRSYLEMNNVPFTIWDYKGVFGVFKNGHLSNFPNERFPEDLNTQLLRALNFNVPQ